MRRWISSPVLAALFAGLVPAAADAQPAGSSAEAGAHHAMTEPCPDPAPGSPRSATPPTASLQLAHARARLTMPAERGSDLPAVLHERIGSFRAATAKVSGALIVAETQSSERPVDEEDLFSPVDDLDGDGKQDVLSVLEYRSGGAGIQARKGTDGRVLWRSGAHDGLAVWAEDLVAGGSSEVVVFSWDLVSRESSGTMFDGRYEVRFAERVEVFSGSGSVLWRSDGQGTYEYQWREGLYGSYRRVRLTDLTGSIELTPDVQGDGNLEVFREVLDGQKDYRYGSTDPVLLPSFPEGHDFGRSTGHFLSGSSGQEVASALYETRTLGVPGVPRQFPISHSGATSVAAFAAESDDSVVLTDVDLQGNQLWKRSFEGKPYLAIRSVTMQGNHPSDIVLEDYHGNYNRSSAEQADFMVVDGADGSARVGWTPGVVLDVMLSDANADGLRDPLSRDWPPETGAITLRSFSGASGAPLWSRTLRSPGGDESYRDVSLESANGDMTGDGVMDLVVQLETTDETCADPAYQGGSFVRMRTVLVNGADGTFGWDTGWRYLSYEIPRSASMPGDFNGNGTDDLFLEVSNEGSTEVTAVDGRDLSPIWTVGVADSYAPVLSLLGADLVGGPSSEMVMRFSTRVGAFAAGEELWGFEVYPCVPFDPLQLLCEPSL